MEAAAAKPAKAEKTSAKADANAKPAEQKAAM
jgi:competence protein ComEA